MVRCAIHKSLTYEIWVPHMVVFRTMIFYIYQVKLYICIFTTENVWNVFIAFME